MDRPTTAGGPAIRTHTADGAAKEEEEDDDAGMFSFLPPTQHQVHSPQPSSHLSSAINTAHGTGVSPAAAYAAHFIKNDTDMATSLARSRNAHGLAYDASGQYIQDPFGGLSASQAVEGYTVHSARSPVIELASRIKEAQHHVESDGSPSGESFKEHSGKTSLHGTAVHHPDAAEDMYGNEDGIHALGYAKEGGNVYEEYAAKMRHFETYDGTDPMELLDDLVPEEEDSPFPEVRASVSNIDDPEMPCLTFRSWTIGLVLTSFCAGLNLFFQLRYPSPYLTPILIQIIAYPIGKAFARFMPTTSFPVPGFAQRWFGWDPEWSLNPGPFNIKEHTVIIVMANSAISPAYALNLTLILDKYYNTPKGIGFDICMVLSSQMIGYGFAGLCRRFLVWPAGMIWPSNLVICTLLNTFHAEDDDGRDGSMTRYRFFAIVTTAAFAWYFLPNFLFTALSFFSWVCWIWPNNIVVNQLFGTWTGLGMGLLTFDWGQIAYIGSPLIVPWWAIMNVFVGFVFFYWFLTPILYYANFWFFSYMPMFSVDVYDRFGAVYEVERVVDANFSFNSTAYAEYSPLYMPATYVSVYCIAFALSTAAIVHTILYHGKSVVQKLKNVQTEPEDVHAKLMRNYPEVPDWWYAIYTLVCLGLAMVAIEVFDTGMPIWSLFVSLGVAVVYILPGGFIFAMTSQQITLNLLAELIPGYMLPGRPIAVMAFKTFCVQALGSGLTFTQDLKLGHYMKLPPRITFTVQIVCGIISCLVQIGTKAWLESAVPDLCSPEQATKALLVCPIGGVFFSSSIIWGLIGPRLQFSTGALYHPMLYFTLIGALLPLPVWLMNKRWPKSWLRYINIPVLLTGASYIPPGTGINYVSWFIVGFIFQFWMRRHRFRWWSKFNFVLSASMEGGTLLSGIVIFLCLQLPKGGLSVKWWGNEVYQNTADWTGPPYRTPPAEGWGPSSGWMT